MWAQSNVTWVFEPCEIAMREWIKPVALKSVTCDLAEETKPLLLLEAFLTAFKGELFHWNKSEYLTLFLKPEWAPSQ